MFAGLTAVFAAQPALSDRGEPERRWRSHERATGPGGPVRVEWPRENPPRPLPARPAAFPPYELRKLSNGLQVVLVHHNEQPSISVRMIVRAGAAHDPKGKHGLAMMTATLLDQGAGGRTAEQIAEQIDFIGGALGAGAGTDLTYINAVVMNDSYSVALDLVSDVAQRPTFAREEIERQRAAGDVGAESVRRRSRIGGRPGDRSPDLRLPSLRDAGQRHGRIAGVAHARGLRGLPSQVLRAEQRPDRGGGGHQRRRCDGGAGKAFWLVEAGRGARRRP